MENRQGKAVAISRWLQEFANYLGIICGITRIKVDFHTQTIKSSLLMTVYVLIINILTAVSLPFLYFYIVTDVTGDFTNNLLILTDIVNLAIIFSVVAFSILSRYIREMAYIGLLKEIFALDRAYFRALPTMVEMQRCSNHKYFTKMLTSLFYTIWPFVGTLQARKKIDMKALLIAFYFSFIIAMCNGTLNLYLIQTLEIQYRVCVLNTNLEKLRTSLESMHRCSRGRLHGNCVSLKRLVFATTSDLGELAKVHGRLSRLVVRLNNTFKCQVIGEVLRYIVTNVSYWYFLHLVANSMIDTIKSPFLWVANLSTAFLALLDINLLYWISHSTTHALQETAHILQRYRTLPFTSQNLERQCELFCLQLCQQETEMRIGGMFSLNRQTSLAMGAFMLRHIIILVQFDYESRISGASSSITINSLVDMFRFGKV